MHGTARSTPLTTRRSPFDPTKKARLQGRALFMQASARRERYFPIHFAHRPSYLSTFSFVTIGSSYVFITFSGFLLLRA